jgi:molecular chaperone GrpE
LRPDHAHLSSCPTFAAGTVLDRARTKSETTPMSTLENDPVHQQEASGDQQIMTEANSPGTDGNHPENTATDATTLQAELDVLRTEHQALHDKHVRLYAEFDNFRKRTARERLELIQYAGEGTLKAILPVLDDLERAVANNEKVDDAHAVKEGVKLIHQKLLHILAGQGLKPMEDPKGQPFDTDRHEAITNIPAPSDDLKGRVVDVVEPGYTLNDKVVRYAKVVVGA